MGAKTFQDLIVWQKAHDLVLKVYKITAGFLEKDKFNFYYYAESSLEELKYQILLSFDLKYIKKDEYFLLVDMCDEVGRILNGWIKSTKKQT